MKLVPKLSLAFIAGLSIILAANGYVRIEREVALFESAHLRGDVAVGETLGKAVSAIWRADGADAALGLVSQAAEKGGARIRWVWLDGSDVVWTSERLAATGALRGAPSGEGIIGPTVDDARRYTLVSVSVPPPRPGALEISEPLETERAYIRRTILDTAVTMLTLDVVCAVLAMLLGAWLVGRPAGALMDKARRVGRADFDGPLLLTQKDELGELAREMNGMCVRLKDAQLRLASETQARIAMLEQLRHADRLMTVGKLASGVAHELGTPLNVVEARASMIAGRETTLDEAVDYARVIVDASERMTRIIRQLLAFARPRALEKTRCDLGLLARRTLDLLEPLADKRDVALRLEVVDGPVQADADAGQIEQVLTNLVMNGIQAMDRPGVVNVCVDRARARPPAVDGAMETDVVRVRVCDEGRGIAEEHLAHVFEPFFSTKEVGEGTGLGLSVTHGIVREHGGWIVVASEPGRRTELTVYLPASAAS